MAVMKSVSKVIKVTLNAIYRTDHDSHLNSEYNQYGAPKLRNVTGPSEGFMHLLKALCVYCTCRSTDIFLADLLFCCAPKV